MRRYNTLIVCLTLLLFITEGHGCTAFRLKTLDGAHVYCRSMEFGYHLYSNVLIVSRGAKYKGRAEQGKVGRQWEVKYGFVGMNQGVAKEIVSDGMNEKGLVGAMLYLSGFTKYQTPLPDQMDKSLGGWELITFLLGTCANLDEVKTALSEVVVAEQTIAELGGIAFPLHFYLSDAEGRVLVVEYIEGKAKIYENPTGVLTNSPTFDWHLINLRNFVNLSPNHVTQGPNDPLHLESLGQGSGLLGLPGDFMPPSRFVRALFFSHWATPQKTALDGVRLGFHLLNTFDLFEGISLDKVDLTKTGETVTVPVEPTQWVIVHDQTNLQTYVRGYSSLKIQGVDLKKIDFQDKPFREIPLQMEFDISDATLKVTPLKASH